MTAEEKEKAIKALEFSKTLLEMQLAQVEKEIAKLKEEKKE